MDIFNKTLTAYKNIRR